jgi:glycosyl transferase family 25
MNLEKDEFKKQNCLFQLKKNNITNYEFFKAINTSSNIIYDTLYNKIIKNMDEKFTKNNFSKGALGCLLSHIEIIKIAKKNNYQKILILEDDFLMINNFKDELNNLFSNIDDNWD